MGDIKRRRYILAPGMASHMHAPTQPPLASGTACAAPTCAPPPPVPPGRTRWATRSGRCSGARPTSWWVLRVGVGRHGRRAVSLGRCGAAGVGGSGASFASAGGEWRRQHALLAGGAPTSRPRTQPPACVRVHGWRAPAEECVDAADLVRVAKGERPALPQSYQRRCTARMPAPARGATHVRPARAHADAGCWRMCARVHSH